MQIQDLKPNTPLKKIKRIGRGGKRGTYSGRGQKGQKARAGHRIRPALRDTLIRTPKLRGYHNKPKKEKPVVLSLSDLNKVSQEKIDINVLKDAKLIRKSVKNVKIVGNGEIKSAKTIIKIPVSKSAKEKIEKVGGSIVLK